MSESAYSAARAARGADSQKEAVPRQVPTLRLGPYRVQFPSLPEVMPLLYFGILTLLVAAILAFTEASVSLGRLPFWWYLLGLGLIAVIGALAAAYVQDDEDVKEGDQVGRDLIAVRTEDWEVWQAEKSRPPAWEEESPSGPSDPIAELANLHQELEVAGATAETPTQAMVAPTAPARALTTPMVGSSSPEDHPNSPTESASISELEEITSRVPPVTSPARPTAPTAAGGSAAAGAVVLRNLPSNKARCASCDRDSVPMDPTFRCSSCGRGLCLECAPQFPPRNAPSLCPVCRTFDDFASTQPGPRPGRGGPKASAPQPSGTN